MMVSPLDSARELLEQSERFTEQVKGQLPDPEVIVALMVHANSLAEIIDPQIRQQLNEWARQDTRSLAVFAGFFLALGYGMALADVADEKTVI